MPSPSEVLSEIVSDGKVTISEAKRYLNAGGRVSTLLGRGVKSLLTGDAKSFLRARVDILKALPASLKILGGLSATAATTLWFAATDPVGFLQKYLIEVIPDMITNLLLIPLGQSIFIALRELLRVLALLVYGGNYRIGLGGSLGGEAASTPGLLDIPFLISRPIAGFNLEAFAGLTGFVQDGIQSVSVPIAEQTGLAAPVVTSGFWAVVLFGGAWVLWVVARSVDVPFINPTGTLLAVTAPIRRIIDKWF